MNFLHEYQSLVGSVIALVACYEFMYKPTIIMITQNTKRISKIEDALLT